MSDEEDNTKANLNLNSNTNQMDIDQPDNNDAKSISSQSEPDEIPNELLNEKLENIMSKLAELNIDKEIGEKEKHRDTRVIIESIELDNFKSYADHKQIGPLHYRFNAVVGPNGSGKSNLMESLLFVFGKRAKKMRLNKLSELIHNSTARTTCRTGRVTIKFKEIKEDTEDSFHYIPGGEFTLAREVFKNSSSRYTLNGKEISFEDLTNILDKKGIDLKHNRFLILQGEVEQISMMKQKATNPNETGLLEFLEDIIGTSRYVPLIEKLGKSIDELTEIKSSKEHRVKITKNELNQLESVKNSSTEYYHNEKDVLILKHLDLSIKRENGAAAIEQKKTALQAVTSTLAEAENQIKVKIDENSNILKEHKKIRNDQDELIRLKEDLTKKAEEFDEEDRVKRSDIEANVKFIKKIEQHVEKLNRNYQNQNENITNAKESNPKMKGELETLKKLFNDLDEEMLQKEKEIFNKTDTIQKRRKECEAKLQPTENEINTNKFQIEQNNSTIGLIGDKVTKINNEITQLEAKEKEINAKIAEKKGNLKQIDTVRIELESNKLQQENDFEDKSKVVDAKYRELQNLLSKISDIKSVTNERNAKGKILQGLLKAQSEGKLSGILGRLGDLGSIDEKYDCAITTACGYLDSIVVESVDNAQKALTYLKKFQLGQATFLILDKIRWVEKNMKSNFNLPSNCQRLFDLVKYNNSKLQSAFYFALRDTLVTSDIKTAMKIAYGETRHRVVTLIGEVIEVYGTIRGGGKSKSGGMSNIEKASSIGVAEEEFNTLNKQYEKVIKEYDMLKIELNGAETAMHKLSANLQEAMIAKGKIENDLTAMDKIRKEITQALSNSRLELSKYNKEKNKIEELTKENSKMLRANEALTASTAELRRELDDINSQINSIMGDDHNKKKEDWKALKKKTEQMEKEINHNENILRNATETLEKIKAEIAMKEKTKTEYLDKIEQCKKDLIDLETKALNVFGEIDKCEKGISQLEAQFNTMNKEAESLKNVIKKMKDDLEKYKSEINDITDEIKKMKKTQQNINEEIKNNKRSYGKLITDFGFIEDFDKEIKEIKQADTELIIKDNNQESNAVIDDDDDDKDELTLIRPKLGRLIISDYLNNNSLKDSFTEEELIKLQSCTKDISYQLTMLQTKITESKPNMSAIQQYKSTLLQLMERKEDLNKTITKLQQADEIFNNVKSRRTNEFMEGYTIINGKLKEMYQLITNGGDAELELADTLDPFSDGISFAVRPPKKCWKVITNLSGGEKTLSSLSLIFALHHYKPSPLYVLDEIDAALDFRNVSIIANYIKEQTRNSQFVIISLRNHMFDLADKLVGIYKTEDITKCVILNPESVKLINKEEEKE